MTENNNYSSINLITFLWKWRFHILILTIVAAAIGAVVSLMIEEKYRSTVILYPTMSNSVAFTDEVHTEQSATAFGEEEQAEQMIQILKASPIRDQICKQFDLMAHYDIKPEEKYAYTKLFETYSENISFKRTKFGSVEISVLDKDPIKAAEIANTISNLLDSVKNAMIKERSLTVLEVAKTERESLKLELNQVVDSMSRLSKLGVVGTKSRAGLEEAYANANDAQTRADLKRKIEMNDLYGSKYASYEYQLEWLNIRLSTKESVYEQAKADVNAMLSHKFVVEKAYPAEKKAYPVRWLIVVVSGMATFLFSIIFLLLLEKLKEFKKA